VSVGELPPAGAPCDHPDMVLDAIWLDRGGCEGTCPVYRVTLRADGRALWEGRAFVDRLGTFHGGIDEEAWRGLARYVERCGFLGWADQYQPEEFVTDHPEYRIGATWDGGTKEVLQYATKEPPGFGRLAKRIDSLADGLTWTR
jgi:hypothetical protein